MSDPTTLPYLIERESWGSLAYMMEQFELELDMKNPKAKKVKKELEIVRKILCTELRKMEDNSILPPAAFFVHLAKTIERSERGLENNGVKNKSFLLFLKLVLHKLKKERLRIFKPTDRFTEFYKMKDWTEDTDALIR